jgi:hypothetical protein
MEAELLKTKMVNYPIYFRRALQEAEVCRKIIGGIMG